MRVSSLVPRRYETLRGWVHQQANNGFITFYYLYEKERKFTELRQYVAGEPIWYKINQDEWRKVPLKVKEQKWMHEDS